MLIVLCQAPLSKKMRFKNYPASYEVTFYAPHRRYCSCRMQSYWEATYVRGAPRVTPRSISNNPLTYLGGGGGLLSTGYESSVSIVCFN